MPNKVDSPYSVTAALGVKPVSLARPPHHQPFLIPWKLFRTLTAPTNNVTPKQWRKWYLMASRTDGTRVSCYDMAGGERGWGGGACFIPRKQELTGELVDLIHDRRDCIRVKQMSSSVSE